VSFKEAQALLATVRALLCGVALIVDPQLVKLNAARSRAYGGASYLALVVQWLHTWRGAFGGFTPGAWLSFTPLASIT
jgi:hypothetical protein